MSEHICFLARAGAARSPRVVLISTTTLPGWPLQRWVDPILTNEWEILGWRDVADLTSWAAGVFTHGYFGYLVAGYLMFIAAMHKGSAVSMRLRNGGADTVERTLTPEEYSRTCSPGPSRRTASWSQRQQ